MSNDKNNLRTLEVARQKKNKLNRKQYLEPEARIRELEEDMLKVIEMCLFLESSVQYQEKIMKKLLEGLADERKEK
jgi:hypothetical protein